MVDQNKPPLLPHLKRYTAIGLLSFGALIALAGFSQSRTITKIATAQGDTATRLLKAPLEETGSAAYYDAHATLALAAKPAQFDRARQAAAKVVLRDPHNLTAWNRLAYIDIARNGHLTKEGVAALIKSYEVSPYGDVSDMIWRVDLATRFWTSLPDSLRTKTLSQIPIIGRFGVSWEWRITQCKTNPHPALQDAICDIAPNVDRTAPLVKSNG